MFVCIPWNTCNYTSNHRWLVMEMEGSRSDSSRGDDRNPIPGPGPRIAQARSSGDHNTFYHDNSAGLIPSVRKIWRERSLCSPSPRGAAQDVQQAQATVECCGDVSLRQWLDNPERTVDALECLHIFSQIVDIVNLAHSQGIVVQNVRPSCFIMSSFNRVSFIESASCSVSDSDSDSDSQEYTAEFLGPSSPLPHDSGNDFGVQDIEFARNPTSQMNSEICCLQSSSDQAQVQTGDRRQHSFPMKQILLMESSWYSSPEEASGTPTCASDIYQLGVLLFELFCTFGFTEEKSSTMASLRHRILPPQLLLKWPKVALFCLQLLHHDPRTRPKMSELLQSEFLNEPRNCIEERQAAIELREKIEEQELLLEFLLLLQQRKQDAADLLNDTISFISSDIEEVTKLQTTLRIQGGTSTISSSPGPNKMNITEEESGSRKRNKQGIGIDIGKPDEYDNLAAADQSCKTPTGRHGSSLSTSSRLMKNFRKLESTYFSTRQRALKPTGQLMARQAQISSDSKGHVLAIERSSISNPSVKEPSNEHRQTGWISTFVEGFCKYLSVSKLKVKADLKQGDLLNSLNLVCSLSFDRDGEFFATAGVNKKIKVFEYNSISSEDHDIHYPVVEMTSRSKLSSICWNGYIKSQIASSNFEGVVQVWDVTRSQTVMEMREHERRVWSVDFSMANPTMLASGSDDGSVKLWNINQGVSVCTIKTKANVCCVQFPTDSGCSLAFGSADHRIYYYDLRNSKVPLCTLVGHNKTVSYVKFIDSTTLVSASTDNTLKLWDLSMCTSRVLDCPLRSFTGHLNVKNFVGLSVSEGYIATGSETNEVFIYHKAFPMPAMSFKFNSTNPFLGDELDDTTQFISSVCWRGQTSTLVAANSMGNIKLLEMV